LFLKASHKCSYTAVILPPVLKTITFKRDAYSLKLIIVTNKINASSSHSDSSLTVCALIT